MIMEKTDREKRLKVLLVNGSALRSGNTFTALSEVMRTLREVSVDAVIMHIGNRPVQGCVGCYKCKEKGICVFRDETYLTLRDRLAEADGIIIGSPVYFGGPSGSLCALLDRLFYSCGQLAQYKPAASVVVCRRGGATATFDRLNKYFTILNMPVVPSQYWNSVHGRNPGEASPGCGRASNHAHTGSQHGVDAEKPAQQRSPSFGGRTDTHKLYQIISL